jgi:uncharacterized phage-like protein YoqJ
MIKEINCFSDGDSTQHCPKTACFTGHRKLLKAELSNISHRLDETIAELISKGILFFGSGMALGFDILAAKAVLRARENDTRVKLIAVLPCRNQDARWNEADKQEYRNILDSADKIVYVADKYYDGCMKERNLKLIKHSSICVAYMKHGRSGTGQTVRIAREYGLAIINIAEK